MSLEPVARLLARQRKTGVRNTNRLATDIINEGLDDLGSRTKFLHYSDRSVISVRLRLPMHTVIGTLNNHLEYPVDNTHPNFLCFLVQFNDISTYTPSAHTVNVCLAMHDFYSLPRFSYSQIFAF